MKRAKWWRAELNEERKRNDMNTEFKEDEWRKGKRGKRSVRGVHLNFHKRCLQKKPMEINAGARSEVSRSNNRYGKGRIVS